jgi:hypothetical protein
VRRALFVTAIVVVSALGWTASATATTIQFDAANLGGDVWRYVYSLSGDLLADQGFVVFFDETLYSSLQPLPPTPVDWDLLVTQPDLALQSAGAYDALALVDSPSFAGPFSVSFNWLGSAGTVPGRQPFQIYQLDASGFPAPLEDGMTSPLDSAEVPEPSTLLLVATGVAAGRTWRRRRTRLSGE